MKWCWQAVILVVLVLSPCLCAQEAGEQTPTPQDQAFLQEEESAKAYSALRKTAGFALLGFLLIWMVTRGRGTSTDDPEEESPDEGDDAKGRYER